MTNSRHPDYRPYSLQASQAHLNETEAAYNRFVPRQFLELLGVNDIRKVQLGQQVERSMTILFSDIRDFTSLSESMSPQENFNFLNSYLVQMEPVIAAHGGIIDKYIGDAIMALFPNSPDDALRCSLAMLAKLDEYNAGRDRAGYRPVKIGIGINTGIVILGTVGGQSRMDGTVIGDAVNLASRLEHLTKEYQVPILISEYTLSSLENTKPWSLRFLDRTHVRGKHDEQSVYEVIDADPPALRIAKKHTWPSFQRALAHYHLGDFPSAQVFFSQCLDEAPDDTAAYAYLLRCQTLEQQTEPAPAFADALTQATDLVWLEEYALGIEPLDKIHHQLVADLHALTRAVQAGTSTPQLTQVHLTAAEAFALEEDMMREKNYSFIDLHQRQHQRFFDYLHEMQEEISHDTTGFNYLSLRIKNKLTDWLVNHILNADRHFSHHMSGRNVRAPAP